MSVQVRVDEADIGPIRVGQRATFRIHAYRERTFEDTVSQQPHVAGGDPERRHSRHDRRRGESGPGAVLVHDLMGRDRRARSPAWRLVRPERRAALSQRRCSTGVAGGRSAWGGRGGEARPRAWIQGCEIKPTAVQIEIRAGDDRFAEIISGLSAEGDKVIVLRMLHASAGISGLDLAASASERSGCPIPPDLDRRTRAEPIAPARPWSGRSRTSR